jgi:hypothetical protein
MMWEKRRATKRGNGEEKTEGKKKMRKSNNK